MPDIIGRYLTSNRGIGFKNVISAGLQFHYYNSKHLKSEVGGIRRRISSVFSSQGILHNNKNSHNVRYNGSYDQPGLKLIQDQRVLIKGELGELEFYFRKIPPHQQKFLVVSLGCREI